MTFVNNKKNTAAFGLIASLALSACSQLQTPPASSAQATVVAPVRTISNVQPVIATGSCDEQSGLHCDLSGLDKDPDIWKQLPADYALDTRDYYQPRVRSQLQWYLEHPNYLKRVSERSERYLHFIVEKIRERGMPAELALLPAVESTYDPFAYSPGRAAGLWQFVPITATHVGLKQSWWYDARRDVVHSTEAALDYLQELNKRFDGDWLLTLAAYNSGATTVNRAIRSNKRHGKPTDYWSLKLPYETQRYVPKLLALSQLVKEAEKHQVELPPVLDRPYFDIVKTAGQIDLAQAAELAGVSIDEVYRLNPGFNRWATDPNGPHRLLLPREHSATFKTRLASIPAEQRLHWQRYKVQPGDNLIKIARMHRTDVATIKASNRLQSNRIRIGQVLMLPSATRKHEDYRLSADQRLASAQNGGARNGSRQRIYYQVRQGDSLWTIARRHDVTVKQLTKWNNMAPRDTIRPGQKLALWKPRPATALAVTTSPNEVIRKVGYTVRSGDSLARIASRFRVKVGDIIEWNAINPAKYLQPGQYLTLYVDVTRASMP